MLDLLLLRRVALLGLFGMMLVVAVRAIIAAAYRRVEGATRQGRGILDRTMR